MFVVAVLLGIDCAVLAVSSVPISRLLYQAGLAPKVMSSMWLNVHKVSSYALCILAVVHLAMHWASILKHLNIPFDPSKRAAIGWGVKIAAGVGSVALGVVGFNSLELFTGADDGETTTSGGNDSSGTGSETGSGSGAGASAGSASATSSSSAASSGSAASPSSGSAAAPGANASGSADSSSSSGAGSAASSTDEDEPSAEDLANTPCPLCKKHCPLSEPQCDKPYLAGLIK